MLEARIVKRWRHFWKNHNRNQCKESLNAYAMPKRFEGFSFLFDNLPYLLIVCLWVCSCTIPAILCTQTSHDSTSCPKEVPLHQVDCYHGDSYCSQQSFWRTIGRMRATLSRVRSQLGVRRHHLGKMTSMLTWPMSKWNSGWTGCNSTSTGVRSKGRSTMPGVIQRGHRWSCISSSVLFGLQAGVPDDDRHTSRPPAPPKANFCLPACLQHRPVRRTRDWPSGCSQSHKSRRCPDSTLLHIHPW